MSPRQPRRPAAAHRKYTHRQFQAAVVRLCRLCGWRYYFTHRSERSPKGFPDLVMVRPPRIIFAELKTVASPNLRPEQIDWMLDLQAVAGAVPEVDYYHWEPHHMADGTIAMVLGGDADAITLGRHID